MYNEITCLFGHHQYSDKPTKDKHGNSIYLCKICEKSGYRKWSAESEVWHDYNGEGNLIHSKWSDDLKVWYDYDGKGNRIHTKWNSGSEVWYEYDEEGNCVHEKHSDGEESWRDNSGCWTHVKPKNWNV